MLERFDYIERVGLFEHYESTPGCEFGELTVVFGENGVGKTTLVAILESLREGDPTELVRRVRLPGDKPARVQVTLGGDSFRFEEGRWHGGSAAEALDVFYSGFIIRNVHSANEVQTAQRRHLCELALGPEAVAEVERLAVADDGARQALADRKEVERQLTLLVKPPDDLEIFIGLPADPEIEGKLEAARASLRRAKARDALLARPLPRVVPAPEFERGRFEETLSRTYPFVTPGVSRAIRQHIADRLDPDGEPWLAYGARHAGGGACPYCQQDLSTSPIAAAIADFFSTGYQAFVRELGASLSDVGRAVGDSALQEILSNATNGVAIVSQWSGDIDVLQEGIPESLARMRQAWTEGAELARKVIDEKRNDPLTAIAAERLDAAAEHFASAVSELEKVNGYFRAALAAAEALRRSLQADDLTALERQLARLENQKARFEPLAHELLTRRSELLLLRREMEEEKGKRKEAIELHARRVVGQYQASINHYLRFLGCDLLIEGIEPSFPSGKASVQYVLRVNGYPVPLGLLEDAPCFETVLSEGDKASLGLAFFFARLRDAGDLSGRTIVLDDPVNSFGGSRRGLIVAVIRELRARGAQVVVLTHDERLAALIWRDKALKSVRPLQVEKAGRASRISPWDIERAIRTEYVKAFLTLRGFLEQGGDHTPAAKAIRPYVEQRLRHLYPGPPFETRDSLGSMIAKIRNSALGDPIARLKSLLQDLEAINDVTLGEHHATDDAPGLEPMGPDETRIFAEKALEILH